VDSHFLRRGPNFAADKRACLLDRCERLGGEIEGHATGERARRQRAAGGEISWANEGMDAALEIAIAAHYRHATRRFSLMAAPIDSGSGPMLPMKVVPTVTQRLNFSLSRY